MKAQKFKVVIESDTKVTSAEILALLKTLSTKSLAVIDWDTKEAEGTYSIE